MPDLFVPSTPSIPEAPVRAAIKAQPLTSREPLVISGVLFGAISSGATAIVQAQTSAGLNWWTLAPLLVVLGFSLLARFGVVSPARLAAVQDFVAGVSAQMSAAAPPVAELAPDLAARLEAIEAALRQIGTAEVPNPDIVVPSPEPPAA